MSRKVLREGLRTFYDEMEERLKPLSAPERQQYLEGLVHALDSITRYAGLSKVSVFERENFIGSAKSWAYSKTHHLNLDSESRMKKLIETDGVNVAKSYKFAAEIQGVMGIPLDVEQQGTLMNVLMVASLDANEG